MNSTLVDWFASDTCRSIHVHVANCICECIRNPSHFPLTSSHIRSGNINTGSQKSLLSQFNGKSSCDSL